MTREEKDLLLSRQKILCKLGFERFGDMCELKYRRIVYNGDIIGKGIVSDIGMIVITVDIEEMKFCILNPPFYKEMIFETTHNIPQKVMDSESIFTDWIVKIIKEDTQNANPAN